MNGSAVMMDIATGKYYNLGETGGRIWNLLEQPTTLSDLIRTLTSEYEVSAEQCKEDVLAFLQQLVDRGLLITD
jgi:hypothetical protein